MLQRLTSHEVLFQPFRSDYPLSQHDWRLRDPAEGVLRVWTFGFWMSRFLALEAHVSTWPNRPTVRWGTNFLLLKSGQTSYSFPFTGSSGCLSQAYHREMAPQSSHMRRRVFDPRYGTITGTSLRATSSDGPNLHHWACLCCVTWRRHDPPVLRILAWTGAPSSGLAWTSWYRGLPPFPPTTLVRCWFGDDPGLESIELASGALISASQYIVPIINTLSTRAAPASIAGAPRRICRAPTHSLDFIARMKRSRMVSHFLPSLSPPSFLRMQPSGAYMAISS